MNSPKKQSLFVFIWILILFFTLLTACTVQADNMEEGTEKGIRSENIITTFTAHDNNINALTFSPDGTRIVSGGSDNMVYVWNASTGEIIASYREEYDGGAFNSYSRNITSVDFSPNGKRVVFGSANGKARVLDVDTGTILTTFGEHTVYDFDDYTRGVSSTEFAPDGKTVASGGYASRDIYVWSAETGKLVKNYELYFINIVHLGGIKQLTFSADGRMLAAAVPGREGMVPEQKDVYRIAVLERETGELLANFSTGSRFLNKVAFSERGNLFTAGDNDSFITWDIKTGEKTDVLYTGDYISAVYVSPEENLLAVADNENEEIRILDAQNLELKYTIPYKGYVLAFSPDGSRIAAASDDSTEIAVWNLNTEQGFYQKPAEEWQVQPRKIDFGESTEINYMLYNNSEETKKYIVKPVLMQPDGVQKDDLISSIIQLEPYTGKKLSWEINPEIIGNWDLNFLIWDYEALEKIIWELYQENTDWKRIGIQLLSGSYLQREGPFKDVLQVSNKESRRLKEKLSRSRKHIFMEMKIPERSSWTGEFIDKFSGAEDAYQEALTIHEQAKDNWQKAETYLQQNKLEAADKFLRLALIDNHLAYAILNEGGDIFIEAAQRGEKSTYAIMRGCQESAKFISLLAAGPNGYKVASHVVDIQNFFNDGFTKGWSEASKNLAAEKITDLIIEKSGILELLNVQGAVSDIEVYNSLMTTLSRSEFVEQLLWEYSVTGLVKEMSKEGREKLLNSALQETEEYLKLKINELENT